MKHAFGLRSKKATQRYEAKNARLLRFAEGLLRFAKGLLRFAKGEASRDASKAIRR
jgi:hypothetical protein